MFFYYYKLNCFHSIHKNEKNVFLINEILDRYIVNVLTMSYYSISSFKLETTFKLQIRKPVNKIKIA